VTEWAKIRGFNRYSVSNTGLVRHDENDRLVNPIKNQGGFVYVGLYRDGLQLKRGVARLVADQFLETDHRPAFDTPINLNGDRFNNELWNLMWRPRWFSIQYHRQFDEPLRSHRAVVEEHTGAYFADALAAASCYGLLAYKVINDTIRGEPVWPTLNKFQFVS
jgi:hypothetical protein